MNANIDRPLVFGNDIPAVMVTQGQLRRLAAFLLKRRIPFESRPFQQNFELVKFPNLAHAEVERLLDQMSPRHIESIT